MPCVRFGLKNATVRQLSGFEARDMKRPFLAALMHPEGARTAANIDSYTLLHSFTLRLSNIGPPLCEGKVVLQGFHVCESEG